MESRLSFANSKKLIGILKFLYNYIQFITPTNKVQSEILSKTKSNK